jgi:hypothetical protein
MIAAFGKLLQVVGLVLLPLGMYLELSGGLGRSGGLSQMLIIFVAGVAMFLIGRLVEGHARQ